MKPAVRVPLFGRLIGTDSKRYAFFCTVFVLLVASSTLPTRAALAVSAVATLAAGA